MIEETPIGPWSFWGQLRIVGIQTFRNCQKRAFFVYSRLYSPFVPPPMTVPSSIDIRVNCCLKAPRKPDDSGLPLQIYKGILTIRKPL